MKWLPIIEDLRHYLISCLHSGNVYDTLEANIMWAADIGKQGTQDIKDKKLDWLFQRNQHDFFGWLLSPSLEYDVCFWCLIFCPWYFLCSFLHYDHLDLQKYFMLCQKAIDLCKLKLVGSFIKLSIFTSYQEFSNKVILETS